MTALLSILLAALPNIFIAILSKVVTQDFMQTVIEKVLIVGLKRASEMTTNTVDDEIVAMITTKLQGV